MAVSEKQKRQRQKGQFEQKLKQRKAALQEKGLDATAIQKDKVVQNLQSDLKRTNKAIASIEANQEIVAKARAKKEENLKKKAEAGPKKKKQKDAPAPEKEGKKKKKKKKE